MLFAILFFTASIGFWLFGKTDLAKAYVIPNLIAGLLIMTIGIGLFYPALATITYVTLPQKLRDHGASLYQFTRNAGSAVAIAIIVILMDRFNKINISELSYRVKDTYNKNEGLMNNINIYPLNSSDTSIYINLITEESHLISFINIMVLLTYLPLLFFPFFLLFKNK